MTHGREPFFTKSGPRCSSGQTIPDDRVEADPAAELTVDEANQS